MTIRERNIVFGTILAALFVCLCWRCSFEQSQRRLGKWAEASARDLRARAAVYASWQERQREAELATKIQALAGDRLTREEALAVARTIRAGRDKVITQERILRLITAESWWDPKAVGAAGEQGLMQLKPSSVGLPAHELRDPVKNVAAGIPYLRGLVRETGELGLALVAYNRGLYEKSVRYALAVLGE